MTFVATLIARVALRLSQVACLRSCVLCSCVRLCARLLVLSVVPAYVTIVFDDQTLLMCGCFALVCLAEKPSKILD